MSARADSLARLLERGRQQQQNEQLKQRGAAPNFLSYSEAERMVKSLRPAAIHEFGTPAFLELHHTVEQLAMQAHHNAATHSDEFVADLLASHQGRLGALVRGLLSAEAWRERVFAPHLKGVMMTAVKDNDNDNGCDPWVLYCALRHEAALASLLELCLFRASSGGGSGSSGSSAPPSLSLLLSDSEAIELADWCVRRLGHLALLSPGGAGTRDLAHPIARAGAWRRELMMRAAGEAKAGGADDNDNKTNNNQEARVRALAAAARALMDAPPDLELDDRVVETEFQAALPALGLTRWLADAACAGSGNDDGDTALLSRLVGRPSASKGDDAVTLLAQLLERPPWERKEASGGVERYCCGGGGGGGGNDASSSSSSSWTPAAASDRHVLAPQAAQAWLALCRLLCDPTARALWLAACGGVGGTASSSSSSVAAVLRLRRPLASPLLLDQAPFLVSLARVVEGLAMMASNGDGGGGGFASSSSLVSSSLAMVVEPLPGLRAAALAEAAKSVGGNNSKDWARAVAEAQAKGAFSAAASREVAQARAASVARAFEQYCLWAGDGEGGGGADDDTAARADAGVAAASLSTVSTAPTTAHVTCWRKAGCDLWEPWGDFVCRVDDSKKRGGGEEVAVGGGAVRGLRRRLLPVNDDDDHRVRPFPCEGKVAVRVGDRVAEARLSLPALHNRRCDGEEGGGGEGDGNDNDDKAPAASTTKPPPAVVWVSVGDLARDGFVLQLRLGRVAPERRERDRASGLWYAYAPLGAGALTTVKAVAE